ncbi:MAG: DinB family protein [Saprospiraceae bacterium]|nr:DinB family protein [Saprospiraceae bacterium]MDW8230602.1 DinB family protein [Saprospiraceae bacterium]
MTLEDLLRDYAAYNCWANDAFVQWLRSKPIATMTTPVASSFPTIRDTLLHIWGAEKIWLERLRQQPTEPFLPTVFQGTMAEVFDGLLAASAALAEYLQGQPADFFQQSCTFRLFSGKEDTRPRYQMTLHCIQHSTYHRGQLVTMGRALGFTDPPQTDYIHYARLAIAL